MKPPLDAILLAAGQSRRMGYPKPLLRVGGETFLSQSIKSILSVLPRVIVVLGAHAARIRAGIASDSRIVVVDNPDWPAGQLSSLKAGLSAVDTEAAGVLVHLADHPLVRRETFERVIERFAQGCGAIVIARNAGKRGHPVIFARSVLRELIDAPA